MKEPGMVSTVTSTRLGPRLAEQAKQLRPSARAILERFDLDDAVLLVQVLTDPIEYVPHPSFSKPATEQELFGPAPSSEGEQPPGLRPGATLSTEGEQRLFKCYNYARFQICRRLAALKGRRLGFRTSQELLRWHKRALEARSQIVQANVPLVLAMAKRTRLAGVDFADLISEGNMALLRSVDKFDCARGFKFSTYACRAIIKSFSRVAMRTSRYRCHFPTEFDPMLEKSDFIERRRETTENDCASELRAIVDQNVAGLSEVEQAVIRLRFALDGSDPQPAAKTLEQVGEIIGVTKERVRQIQNKALAKLRTALEENVLVA
jgi:RNA polymerase sigma factor (sigma-70 family)